MCIFHHYNAKLNELNDTKSDNRCGIGPEVCVFARGEQLISLLKCELWPRVTKATNEMNFTYYLSASFPQVEPFLPVRKRQAYKTLWLCRTLEAHLTAAIFCLQNECDLNTHLKLDA